MNKTILTRAIGNLAICITAGSALVGCGGGSVEQSETKLLAQTGCVSTYCYGHTNASSSSVQFWVKTAPWADVHYTVNGGGQQNIRMTKVNGNNAYTVSGLSNGSVVRYYYTIGNTTGGATNTAWVQFTFSSTTSTPTPTPAPAPAPSGSFPHLTEAQFNSWFPNRVSFYTYSGFVGARSYYPGFANSGNSTNDKREVAAFFANLSHESDYLRAVREYNTANWPHYCDVNWVKVTCDSTNMNDQYFGRGPIQISWTSNYRNLSNALGLGTQLVDNPEMLATNSNIAWRSALWFWMTQTGSHSMTPNHAMRNALGFGNTIRSINGALECDGKQPAKVQSRIERYNMMTQTLAVTAGSLAGC